MKTLTIAASFLLLLLFSAGCLKSDLKNDFDPKNPGGVLVNLGVVGALGTGTGTDTGTDTNAGDKCKFDVSQYDKACKFGD